MAKVNIPGLMETFIKDNGLMDLEMVMELKQQKRATNMKGFGRMVKKMVMVNKHGKMELPLKDNLKKD